MKNNNNYQLYPKAIDDLEFIYLYSVENFGSKKADNYIKKIESSFQNLAVNPSLARPCEYIFDQLRAINIGSHIAFFKATCNGIVIIRILHQSMDCVRHLKKETVDTQLSREFML